MNLKIQESFLDPAVFTERFINQTNRSIFLTGKAGTGKTTLLHKIVSSTHKNTVIVAPTGIAALNAGGVTIHSFFQLPFGAFIPDFKTPQIGVAIKSENKTTLKRHFSMNRRRISLIRSLELLIIDEVSMLRADLLDAIDWTMRTVRRINLPFGGVQVLFIGDLHQLPPVVKNDEWALLKLYYKGIHFFNAVVFAEEQPIYIELEKIYRQVDSVFIELLNNLRNNAISEEDLTLINKNVQHNLRIEDRKGYITLTTHNNKADEMNLRELEFLKEKSYSYQAEITGDFPTHLLPLDVRLELKVGAQIMFIKNDVSFDKQFYNGKMGFVDSLSKDEIIVNFPEEKKKIVLEKFEWTNIKYSLDEKTQEIKEEVLGTFVHYPIKLAWAITIHKSQGLTFEKAILDVADAFAPGQAYVAFSRLRSLEGLILLNPLKLNGIPNDQQMMAYSNSKFKLSDLDVALQKETFVFLKNKILEAFDWYDTFALWTSYSGSISILSAKSEKFKQTSWVKRITDELAKTNEPATKFRKQISALFQAEKTDLVFINSRINAAYSYFFDILDPLVLESFRKLLELNQVKKTKQVVEELEPLCEELLQIVLALKRLRLFFEAITNGKEITKEIYRVSEIENYKVSKLAVIQNDFRQNKVTTLLEFDDGIGFIPLKIKNKAPKEQKKSTYDQTLELVHLGKDVHEIAKERQLSVSTINGHFAQLIRVEKIELKDVMEQKRITEIKNLLEGKEFFSLSKIREELNNQVSWDELRLYQASTII
ncbi:MAG: hypothetical protein RL528_1139 [Bacteroidota bacterium]|jgi:GTPase SAR1 family protein